MTLNRKAITIKTKNDQKQSFNEDKKKQVDEIKQQVSNQKKGNQTKRDFHILMDPINVPQKNKFQTKNKKSPNKNNTTSNKKNQKNSAGKIKQSPSKHININTNRSSLKDKKYFNDDINQNTNLNNSPRRQRKQKGEKNFKEKRDTNQIESQGIRIMVQNFQKTIENPIQIIEKLQNSNTLQRCQVHNSIFTLYCSIDRKPLCVGCMYQGTDHKNHRVLPLNKANQSLREDSEAYLNKVQSIVKATQQLIKRTNQNIIIVERQYPSIMYKIQYFYSAFHQMLRQKQKQQIQRLKSLKQQWKKQFHTLSQQLHRMNYFMTDKVNFQHKKLSDQYLLTKRCILQTLAKAGKVIKEDMVIYEKGKFDTQLTNLDLVKDLINYRLTLVTPVFPNSFINKRKSLFKTEQYIQPQSSPKIQPIAKKNQSKVSVKKQFSIQKKNPKGIIRGFVPLSPVAKLHRTVSFN